MSRTHHNPVVGHPFADWSDDLKLGKEGNLTVLRDIERGHRMTLRKIGAGQFAEVYITPDYAYIVAAMKHEDTPDKEILVHAHEDAPDNPHLPAIEKLGTLTWRGPAAAGRTRRWDTGADVFTNVYVLPVYDVPVTKAKSAKAWKDFQVLKKASDASHRWPSPWRSGYEHNVEIVEAVKGKVSSTLHEALEILVSWAANFSDQMLFEFAARNLAVDGNGNLVLLDPLFQRRR